VGLVPFGTKGIDVMVASSDGLVSDAIQENPAVSLLNWQMSEKHEVLNESSPIFAFVAFMTDQSKVFAVPGSKVGEVVRELRAARKKALGKKVQEHKDAGFRKIECEYKSLKIPSALTGCLEQYLLRQLHR
jgi:hypothetical protein